MERERERRFFFFFFREERVEFLVFSSFDFWAQGSQFRKSDNTSRERERKKVGR